MGHSLATCTLVHIDGDAPFVQNLYIECVDCVMSCHHVMSCMTGSTEELESSLDEIEQRLSTLWGEKDSVNAAEKGIESDADLPLETLALMDTVRRTPDLQAEPFRDMLKGMRMDVKPDVRYRCFEDLYTYCYRSCPFL